MKFGLFLLPLVAEVETLRETVLRADREPGIHSVWVPEPHLLAFDEYNSVFPYSEDGKMPEGYSVEGELDGFSGLTYIAAITERVRIGLGVCIVAQREPVSLAKQVTTLDILSKGRFDCGVGIGWLEEEFRAVGASFKDRVAGTAANLDVMETLWSESGEGAEQLPEEISGGVQEPFPVQKPHPPIHFGGNSRPAIRRVAERGQGWLPWELTPEEAEAGIAKLEELLAANGRSRDEIFVTVATEQPLEEIDAGAYSAAGVDQLLTVVQPTRSPQEVDQLFARLDSSIAAVAAT
jgi:probable F420-dependent oxidoreductase